LPLIIFLHGASGVARMSTHVSGVASPATLCLFCFVLFCFVLFCFVCRSRLMATKSKAQKVPPHERLTSATGKITQRFTNIVQRAMRRRV
jgi:hypothetical protein